MEDYIAKSIPTTPEQAEMVKLAGHMNSELSFDERTEIFNKITEMYRVGSLVSSEATKDAMEQATGTLATILQTHCPPIILSEATQSITGIIVVLCHLCYNLGMLDTSREERSAVKNLFTKKESGNDVPTAD
jgi:hypothetical protein